MSWSERRPVIAVLARLGFVLAAGGLLAGCFEPLYARNPSVGDESVRDKLAEVLIAPIPSRQGTPQARVAVAVRNALQYDLNGAAGAGCRMDRARRPGRLAFRAAAVAADRRGGGIGGKRTRRAAGPFFRRSLGAAQSGTSSAGPGE